MSRFNGFRDVLVVCVFPVVRPGQQLPAHRVASRPQATRNGNSFVLEPLRPKLHNHAHTDTRQAGKQAERQTENETEQRESESAHAHTHTHRDAHTHTHNPFRIFSEHNCRLGFWFRARIPDSQPVAKVFDALHASRELDHYLNQFHYGNNARVIWPQEMHCHRGFLNLALCRAQCDLQNITGCKSRGSGYCGFPVLAGLLPSWLLKPSQTHCNGKSQQTIGLHSF